MKHLKPILIFAAFVLASIVIGIAFTLIGGISD